jgi:uncharacterized protein YcbX
VHVAGLFLYPVKGAAAVQVPAFTLDTLGPVGDRRYCLVRPAGRVFTQRDAASLARLRAMLDRSGLALEFDGEPLAVPADAFVRRAAIRIWSRTAEVRFANGEINAHLTRWFGTPLELARLEQPVRREHASLALGDAAALLIVNAASLDALNAAMHEPVPMARFRPNVVIAGVTAYAEDAWQRLRIGDALLSPVHPCGRCEVTTIDQGFGAKLGPEPLRTLSRLRQRDGEAVFGVRYAVETPGCLRVGDPVGLGG